MASGCLTGAYEPQNGVPQEGDTTVLPLLMSLLDEGDPDFAVVTP